MGKNGGKKVFHFQKVQHGESFGDNTLKKLKKKLKQKLKKYIYFQKNKINIYFKKKNHGTINISKKTKKITTFQNKRSNSSAK